jgi:hypothetical protein
MDSIPGMLPLRSQGDILNNYQAARPHRFHHMRESCRVLVPLDVMQNVYRQRGRIDGDITGYDAQIDVTLRVQGGKTQGAVLTTVLTTGDSAQSGTYDLTVTETVRSRKLVVSGFTMRPG